MLKKRCIEDSADHQNSHTRGNLLTAVMRASYSEEKKDTPTNMSGAQNRKQAFTEDEVMGNLFIYLLAGMAFSKISLLVIRAFFFFLLVHHWLK